jgi:hypothetical protein
MQTILRILERAGGYHRDLHLRIENPPYLPLVIEALPGLGPLGYPAVSVAHYGDLNGDPMRDPEMCFELSKLPLAALELVPYYWRNDYVGIEQYSRRLDGGNYVFVRELYVEHKQFAWRWDSTLRVQRYLEAFERSQKQH